MQRLFGNENVWVEMHRNIASDKVENPNPQSTPQVPPSFEEYTPPVTCPKEVEKTLGTLIEVEPLNETKLEEVGLNCDHNTPLSSREVLVFDGPEPQPLLNSPSLDVSLGDVIGPEPPIKPHSPDNSRMKVIDYLTTQTPPSPHVENSHPKGVYSYYNPSINNPKRHYGFKLDLLGKSVSLGVDISNWEMFDDDWGSESKEVLKIFLSSSRISFTDYIECTQRNNKKAILSNKGEIMTYIKPTRAWYERLSTFLLKHGYRRGAIDKTLFIKKDRRDIMLVQVYVDDIIFGSTKTSMVKDFEDLMQKEFKMSSMGELTFFLGLQVKQTTAGIFLSQDKYVKDILNKFNFRTIKPASTPIEAHKSLGKDEEGEDVDVHLYRSMIGCLMYLTASRPDIMFAVCLCARFQVTPKVSHMHAVKRIFRYLKHQPKLGLWYPKDSPFHLEAFSDSDYAGDNHDRRSTSGGCQYLGRRLVSWQCKKQTIVAISSTEAEYVAAASCCAQVLWMQNQLLDYGFNFMNTEIHIDNESTICIVKNPVLHSKTKHIQIRHHFIRDCYEQRLINVVKVHTDDNVADLLTKGFDLARFNFLVVTIESLEALLLRLRGGYE
ncbi:putative ribonuclease H-like domain-containing protein [Tanacetum coccineum]